MAFLTNLFKTKTLLTTPTESALFQALKSELSHKASFYERANFFSPKSDYSIKQLMLHPDIGIVLFKNFDYDAPALQGTTVSLAEAEDKSDLNISSDEGFLRDIIETTFHAQPFEIYTVLLCDQLTEEAFDQLDESFHALIPKKRTLFKGQENLEQVLLALHEGDESYDLTQIKQTLFAELRLPQSPDICSSEQEEIIHNPLLSPSYIYGLPGSGKSNVLIMKALYEHMLSPQKKMIIFAPKACDVHHLQALIFQAAENTQWSFNPADITVSSFDSIIRRGREKEKYDLLFCDEMYRSDLNNLRQLCTKNARFLATSHYPVDGLSMLKLTKNYRSSPALCAACEGQEVQTLEQHLVFKTGNPIMNSLLLIEKLQQEVTLSSISLVSPSKEMSLQLQEEFNDYFSFTTDLEDDVTHDENLVIHPLNQLSCIHNEYLVIIVDEESRYDPVTLISRAHKKSFILSKSEDIYNTITTIKGIHNETD